MPFDFSRVMGLAEEFLRRHIKPKAVQEAEKRRRQRRMRQAGRRLGHSALLTGTSGTGVLAYGLAVAPVSTAGVLIVGAATLAGAGATLFWPSRPAGGGKISRAELTALVADAEAWLLDQRTTLPTRVLPAVDQVFFRLHDIHAISQAVDPTSTLARDLRRLLADHLPRLVHSYAALPETIRGEEPDLLQNLIDGLATLDEELARICREASRGHLVTFQAQKQFLETRYKGGDRLKGG